MLQVIADPHNNSRERENSRGGCALINNKFVRRETRLEEHKFFCSRIHLVEHKSWFFWCWRATGAIACLVHCTAAEQFQDRMKEFPKGGRKEWGETAATRLESTILHVPNSIKLQTNFRYVRSWREHHRRNLRNVFAVSIVWKLAINSFN